MTSYTVTASNSDGSSGIYLQVEVLTSAAEAGGASASISNGSSGTVTLTPNFTGSFIAEAISDSHGGNTAITPAASNTLLTVAANTDSFQDTTVGVTVGAEYYSGTVTAGVGVTVGYTNPSSATAAQVAVYEVPASGGIWAEDASTPAWVKTSSTNTVTTASFTPPGGTVLVAVVSANYAGVGNPTTTLTVSSTPALTWTPRKFSANSTTNGGSAIFTATIPGSGPLLQGPPLTSRMLPNIPVTKVIQSGWQNAGHSR